MRSSRSRLPILAAAALGLVACHDSDGSGGTTPLAVSSIEPVLIVAYRPTSFTVHGSGYVRSAGLPADITTGVVAVTLPQVTVTFHTDNGTPFENGTSADVQVTGTVVSDTEIQGTLPATNAPGVWVGTVAVADSLGSATSASPLATWGGLTVFDIDEEVIRAEVATPFQVLGLTFLPVAGNATVRFTSTTPGAFPGGVDTLDVPAIVDSATVVSGITPTFAIGAPILAFVSVVLDDEAGTPSTQSTSVLAEFVPAPVVPVVVDTITSPLPIAVATPFTITGSGFLGAGDPDVQVTFTPVTATPFLAGTASSVFVQGTATSNTVVTGTSPTGTWPNDVSAFVTVTRADDVAGESTTPIALFTVPLSTVDTFSPATVRSDTATPFVIAGTNLPASQPVTVRFRAVQDTPFTGGTADTVDVTATVTSSTQIDGTTPLATTSASFLAEVTVVLPGSLELAMGVVCLFTAPTLSPVTRKVTTLANSGAGSLRDTIANATPNCVITFDPSLSGTIDVLSTITVSVPVHVVGQGPGVILVGGGGPFPDFPIFTILPAATGTAIDELAIGGSRHNNDGGGFRALGDLKLTRCRVTGNKIAGRGAGGFVAGGASVTLLGCTFDGNETSNRAGGVFVDSSGTLDVIGCTFDANRSNDGGGAIALSPTATLNAVNCTFHDNYLNGGAGGGAILIANNAAATLLHCTVSRNTSAGGLGGGVLVQGSLTATSCIFSRNAAHNSGPEILVSGGVNNTTFSLVRVGQGSGVTDGVNGNLVGTPLLPKDARLDDLASNGGPTATMALGLTSPARDAASTLAAPARDQRGVARPQGTGPDMGAYESTVNL